MRNVLNLFSIRAACLVLSIMSGNVLASPAPKHAQDVFDTLQENVFYVPTQDGKADLYVTTLGAGTPVVFLHGGPGNDFNYIVDALRPHLSGHQFVLFDQRGSLLSPVAPADSKSLTLDQLVEDLETLRVALGQEKLVLFGHSFGTVLAQAYFRAHPDRVAGLVLAASSPPVADEAHPFKQLLNTVRANFKALADRPAVQSELQKAGVLTAESASSPQARAVRQRILAASTSLWHVERWRVYQGGGVYYNGATDDAIGDTVPALYDTLAVLKSNPVPITIIQGDHDFLDPSAGSWKDASLHNSMVKIVVMTEASHYAWIDSPRLFANALADGLLRASPGK